MSESPVAIDNKHRRAVAGALIDYDDENGVPLYTISAITGLNRPYVEIVLTMLETHAEAEGLLPLKGGKWRITEYGRKAYRDERFASKMRKCLTCGEMFDSSHAGNRICVKCIDSEYTNAERSEAA